VDEANMQATTPDGEVIAQAKISEVGEEVFDEIDAQEDEARLQHINALSDAAPVYDEAASLDQEEYDPDFEAEEPDEEEHLDGSFPEETNTDEERAALQIQASSRGRAGRKIAADKLHKLEGHHKAATRIQAKTRGKLARDKLARMGKQEHATTNIQASARGRTERQTVREGRAATRIQASHRGKAGRSKAANEREQAFKGKELAYSEEGGQWREEEEWEDVEEEQEEGRAQHDHHAAATSIQCRFRTKNRQQRRSTRKSILSQRLGMLNARSEQRRRQQQAQMRAQKCRDARKQQIVELTGANRELRGRLKAKNVSFEREKQAQVERRSTLAAREREVQRTLTRALAKADESYRENHVLSQKLQLLSKKLHLPHLEDEHGQLEKQLERLEAEHTALLHVQQIRESAAGLSTTEHMTRAAMEECQAEATALSRQLREMQVQGRQWMGDERRIQTLVLDAKAELTKLSTRLQTMQRRRKEKSEKGGGSGRGRGRPSMASKRASHRQPGDGMHNAVHSNAVHSNAVHGGQKAQQRGAGAEVVQVRMEGGVTAYCQPSAVTRVGSTAGAEDSTTHSTTTHFGAGAKHFGAGALVRQRADGVSIVRYAALGAVGYICTAHSMAGEGEGRVKGGEGRVKTPFGMGYVMPGAGSVLSQALLAPSAAAATSPRALAPSQSSAAASANDEQHHKIEVLSHELSVGQKRLDVVAEKGEAALTQAEQALHEVARRRKECDTRLAELSTEATGYEQEARQVQRASDGLAAGERIKYRPKDHERGNGGRRGRGRGRGQGRGRSAGRRRTATGGDSGENSSKAAKLAPSRIPRPPAAANAPPMASQQPSKARSKNAQRPKQPQKPLVAGHSNQDQGMSKDQLKPQPSVLPVPILRATSAGAVPIAHADSMLTASIDDASATHGP
jgi:hypothetical protein